MPSVDRWITHWMDVAKVFAQLSKDPSTKVGAVIVTPDNRKCSGGYNGFAKDIEETPDKWERPRKYSYVIHAEENALLNCPFDTTGCKIYITHQPCSNCILRLVNSGITEVYFGEVYANLTNKDIWEEHSHSFNYIGQVSSG